MHLFFYSKPKRSTILSQLSNQLLFIIAFEFTANGLAVQHINSI